MFLQFSELLPSEVHRWRWPGQPQNVRSSVIGWARRRARILTNQKMAFSCIHHRRWEKEKSLLCFSNFSLHRRLTFLKLNIYKIMILRLWKVCCSWNLNDYDANSEALRKYAVSKLEMDLSIIMTQRQAKYLDSELVISWNYVWFCDSRKALYVVWWAKKTTALLFSEVLLWFAGILCQPLLLQRACYTATIFTINSV